MFAKQGDSKYRIKELCIYGILSALCLIFGFVESMIPFSAIAPGVKLGLANSLVLVLIFADDIKGAFFVNIVRILLSSLLFGSALSLLFSFCGGIISLTVSWLFKKTDKFSFVGIGIIGGVVHNTVQLIVAYFVCDIKVFWYLPILIASGGVSGGIIGIISQIIFKRIKYKGKKI